MSKPQLTACIVIVSTTVAAGQSEDKTTGLLKNTFSQEDGQYSWQVVQHVTVGDELKDIQAQISSLVAVFKPNLIVLSGGTGFAKSDVTPEVSATNVEHENGMANVIRRFRVCWRRRHLDLCMGCFLLRLL